MRSPIGRPLGCSADELTVRVCGVAPFATQTSQEALLLLSVNPSDSFPKPNTGCVNL